MNTVDMAHYSLKKFTGWPNKSKSNFELSLNRI